MARRIWVVILAVLAIVLIIYFSHRHGPAPSAPQKPSVAIALVKRGLFEVRVSAHGRVGPPPGSTAQLAFPLAGRIAHFDVHVGEHVQVGQPLAELDSTGLALAVAQARGDLESGSYSGQTERAAAEAAVRQAELRVAADRATLTREQALYSAGIAAAKDVSAARTQLEVDTSDAKAARIRAAAAVANVSEPNRGAALHAQAVLAQAERDLANATLRAPEAGVVLAILKHLGESVDSTTPVVAVGKVAEHTATLNVAAPLAAQIHPGDLVVLTIARSGETAKGKVTASVPAVDPATQTATVVVDGIPASAVAGDAVDATITVASRTATIVPTPAIVQDPESGKTLVFVAQGSGNDPVSFSPRVVRVGSGDQTTTEILSGLQPGERIAAEGAFELLAPAATSS